VKSRTRYTAEGIGKWRLVDDFLPPPDRLALAVRRSDIESIVESCESKLNLSNAKLGDEYYYQSLPFCVIDAVFSIGAHYNSTRNTVNRYREQCPAISEEIPISRFVEQYDEYGAERMANEVFRNRQRTSSRNGTLKAKAVLLFAQTLLAFGVDRFQDIREKLGDSEFQDEFEIEIKKIKGQGSGISARYFYMLAGSDDFVKPDRMIHRFIQSATNRTLSDEECRKAIVQACGILAREHPNLNPRLLDHQMWLYQRKQSR
jgi:hypothetical protein